MINSLVSKRSKYVPTNDQQHIIIFTIKNHE